MSATDRRAAVARAAHGRAAALEDDVPGVQNRPRRAAVRIAGADAAAVVVAGVSVVANLQPAVPHFEEYRTVRAVAAANSRAGRAGTAGRGHDDVTAVDDHSAATFLDVAADARALPAPGDDQLARRRAVVRKPLALDGERRVLVHADARVVAVVVELVGVSVRDTHRQRVAVQVKRRNVRGRGKPAVIREDQLVAAREVAGHLQRVGVVGAALHDHALRAVEFDDRAVDGIGGLVRGGAVHVEVVRVVWQIQEIRARLAVGRGGNVLVQGHASGDCRFDDGHDGVDRYFLCRIDEEPAEAGGVELVGDRQRALCAGRAPPRAERHGEVALA